MNILALDLATTTGFAVGDLETYDRRTALQCAVKKSPQPHTGSEVFDFGRIGGDVVFFGGFQDWLIDMIAVHEADCVVYEAPFVGDKTSQDVARKLFGMATVTALTAYRVERVQRCFPVDNQDVRSHFIGTRFGKRAELKRLTIIECEGRGWTVKNDDEADALALLDYAIHCLTPKGKAAA